MELKHLILGLLIIGVTTKCTVQGLQCYVCEDCNEYEDFKELHICGEIPLETTIRPITLPGQLESGNTEKPLTKPSSKPVVPESGETNDGANAQKNNTKVEANKETTTAKPTTLATSDNNEKSTTATEKPTTSDASAQSKATTTTTTTTTKTTTTSTTMEKNTTLSSSAAAVVSSTKPKPVIATDYEDYLEYEDPVIERRSASLLKMNEPVCYMIKLHVNNTVITNRGCTSFINANKYLTCQSLYNGAPMESCRICSSNGCNKFLSDDGDDDYHGLPMNGGCSLEKLGFVVLILGIFIEHFVN
ncbi:uncharacterized protein ACRADG_004602 [Cochliomyia hominivorax]